MGKGHGKRAWGKGIGKRHRERAWGEGMEKGHGKRAWGKGMEKVKGKGMGKGHVERYLPFGDTPDRTCISRILRNMEVGKRWVGWVRVLYFS